MKRFALVLFMLLLAIIVPIVAGQEAPVEIPEGETAEIAWQALLVLAAAVAGAMEQLKPIVLSPLSKAMGLDDTGYSVLTRIVALLLSMVLVFGTDTVANLPVATGLFTTVPPFVAQLITALGISFGNMFLWALYEFGRGKPPATTPLVLRE